MIRFALPFLAIFLLVPGRAFGQQLAYATLTGTVVEAATGDPLEGVHVFIAASMNGTVTDRDGRFVLDAVPVGAHRLYVSMIGFEPQARDILLREPKVHTYTFELAEGVTELDEVTVTGEGDPRWRERLATFTRLFIGETPNAAETRIVNPEVLDFEEKAGRFRASATEPLVIENRALGYRITYFLKEFVATPTRTKYDGEPLFETLDPDSPEQDAMWRARRRAAYEGSFRHFILAVLNGRVEEEGFHLFHRPAPNGLGQEMPLAGTALRNGRFPVKPEELYEAGEVATENMLTFPGYVEFVYEGDVEDESFLRWAQRRGRPKFQTSMLLLENGPTVVDYKGDVLDPYGITFFGYLAFERVADELPKEYRPE